MIEFEVIELTQSDLILCIVANIIVASALGFLIYFSKREIERWIPRKFIHVFISTFIAFFVPLYQNIFGILLTFFVFVIWLFGVNLLGFNIVNILVEISTRGKTGRFETLLSSTLALLTYFIVLINTLTRLDVFVGAILSVGWGDGAGEIIGRTLGKKRYKRWGHTKSIEGTIGVTLATFLGILIGFILFSSSNIIMLFPILLAVSLLVAIVESICWSWTDNVFLPLITSILLLILT
ncbi:MAG: hypothetical protein ACTSUV_03120 [Candidatus Ranarchaeia archaeon]